jgi:hypothetical protein
MPSTAPRAVKAREALEWCRHGHQKMGTNPTGPDWVLVWAGTIALLRAVGHALLNEDAKRDASLEKEQLAWWDKLKATKPNPSIFWQFIERDRNRFLKEAELTAGQSATVFVQGVSANGRAGDVSGRIVGQEPPQPEEQPPLPSAIYTYHINSGPFAGQDPRDLVRDAIEWWEKQLDDIDQKAAASSP